MQTNNSFLQFSKIAFVTVFLVILAGAVVRTTQSGMGCPDWPKCFGRWIPPTTVEDLPADYLKYLRQQDIDHTFNPYHTWVEYINRLLGAMLGVILFVQLIWSLKYWKTKRIIVWLCLGLVLLTGFQAWLGKKVVDANLAGVKITTHMLVALLIAALAFTVIHLLTNKPSISNKKLKYITFATLLLLLLQIILGTQVREQIDVISKALNYTNRNTWIEKLDDIFKIHRTFSLVITGLCIYIYVQVKKSGIKLFNNTVILICVLAEVALGIVMTYLDIPAIAQPLHMLCSSVLFISLYNNWLKTTI
jgi:heme a synthase